MKIKIIDLLKMNENKLPNRIHVFNTIFEIVGKNYYATSGDYENMNLLEWVHDIDDLNKQVEIKEEDSIFNKDIKLGNYLFSDDGCFYLDSDTANAGKTRCEIIPGCTVGAKDLDIPENKKIKKLSWQQVGFQGCYGDERTLKDVVLDFNEQNNKIGKKINELVEEINKLKENK